MFFFKYSFSTFIPVIKYISNSKNFTFTILLENFSKDTGTSNSENKGGSIKFTPLPSELNVNYNKGKGEKDWVSDQTSIIAKEGGTIEVKTSQIVEQ